MGQRARARRRKYRHIVPAASKGAVPISLPIASAGDREVVVRKDGGQTERAIRRAQGKLAPVEVGGPLPRRVLIRQLEGEDDDCAAALALIRDGQSSRGSLS